MRPVSTHYSNRHPRRALNRFDGVQTKPSKLPADFLSIYLGEIDATPLLSIPQERELALRIANGDQAARDHMVRANLRLVVSIARGYTGRGLRLDDLIAEGNLGLYHAIPHYDLKYDTRFSTYASFWVKHSIREALEFNVTNGAPRVPHYMVTAMAKWRRKTAQFIRDFGRPPTDSEISAALGLTDRQQSHVLRAMQIRALCRHDEGEPEDTLEEILADDRGRDLIGDMIASEELAITYSRLKSLVEAGEVPKLSTEVLNLRFGIGSAAPMTRSDIGNQLGMTRNQVAWVERTALAKLRMVMEPDA